MMKKSVRSVICIALMITVIISALSGCSSQGREVNLAQTNLYENMNFDFGDVTEGLVCENESFSLSWSNQFSQPVFTDKKSGAVYSPMPVEATVPKFDEEGKEVFVSHQVRSSVVIYYEDAATLTENSSLSSADASGVYPQKIENGIKVTYDFSSKEISVAVRYTIEDDHFNISVNPKEASDNGVNRLVGVVVAPFMCGIENDTEDSYLFYPDGSGAIIEPDSRDKIGSQGSMRVYGDDLSINKYALNAYKKQVTMPVFGVKKKNNALLGIITSGAEQAYINWDIGGENKGYSTVSPFFRIRGYDYIARPAVFLGNLPYIQVYDNYISEQLIKVSYYSLSGEDANYNGMARTYREYATQNEIIKESDKEVLGASVEIVGGLETKAFTFGIPHTELTAVTTVSQANEIVGYFTENTDSKLLFNLVGFGTSGLDVGEVGGGFKIASDFGTKKDIAALSEKVKQNNNEIVMDFDIVAFNKNGSGFKKSSDMIRMLDNQTLYLKSFNDVTRNNDGKQRYLLLSRGKLVSAAEKAVLAIQKYGFNGVSFGSLSKSAYSDYQVKGYGLSLGMSRQVGGLYDAVGKLATITASTPNIYAAGNADYVTGAPSKTSGLDITSYEIPFYQMVLAGSVPMTAEAINLEGDTKTAVLKCIETGMAPSFMLSYDYDSSIVTSKFTALSSTNFTGLKEDVRDYINQVSEVAKKTAGQGIVNYTVVSENLRVTEFENGVKLAVNFGDSTELLGDIEIAPKDYMVLEG